MKPSNQQILVTDLCYRFSYLSRIFVVIVYYKKKIKKKSESDTYVLEINRNVRVPKETRDNKVRAFHKRIGILRAQDRRKMYGCESYKYIVRTCCARSRPVYKKANERSRPLKQSKDLCNFSTHACIYNSPRSRSADPFITVLSKSLPRMFLHPLNVTFSLS